MREGRAYTSHDDQAARAEAKPNPNTTIIGVGSNAYLPTVGSRSARSTTSSSDLEPGWDPGDGAGNYNSEFDRMTIGSATHITENNYFTGSKPT
jgi:hypothetical protein